MWVGWQLLFGPGSERLTYGLIAPMASWAVIESFDIKRLRGLAVSAWLVTALLGTGAFERAVISLFPYAPAILPSGVVLFLVWLLAYTCLPKNRADSVGQEENQEPALSQAA